MLYFLYFQDCDAIHFFQLYHVCSGAVNFAAPVITEEVDSFNRIYEKSPFAYYGTLLYPVVSYLGPYCIKSCAGVFKFKVAAGLIFSRYCILVC